MFRSILGHCAEVREKFVVDWETNNDTDCVANADDECSDPQKSINCKIEKILHNAANVTKNIEKFLRVNLPDKSERQLDAPIQNV